MPNNNQWLRVNEARRGTRHIRTDKNDKRLYLDIDRGGEKQTIDVTDVYYFCKELFTSDWKALHQASLNKRRDDE